MRNPFLPFLFLLVATIVAYHAWAPRHVPPIHDASNCVAGASNLGVALARGDLRHYWTAIRAEANKPLSLVYFSLFELALGPGRPAWGGAWGLLVVLGFAGAYGLGMGTDEKRRLLAATALVFAGGPLMFRPGGVLDQRFDPFAALLTSGAALCLSLGRSRPAACLSLLAALAKGPALPLNVLLWMAAFLSGATHVRAVRDDVRRHPRVWVFLAAGAVVYLWLYLPGVTSYNLMVIQAPTGLGKAVLFFRSAAGAVWTSRYFYPSNLLHRTPVFVLLMLGAAAVAIRLEETGSRRPALFGALALVLTYLLFSAHPLKSDVFIVWFAPAAVILALACTHAFPPGRIGLASAIAVIALALQLALVARGLPLVRQPAVRPEFVAFRRHVGGLSRALLAYDLERGTVRLVTNVLWLRDPSLAYNYDAYRVLLFESMGRRAPRLEGWELGTWSDDWRGELARLPASEWFLSVIAVGSEDYVHHRGRARVLAAEFTAVVNPACQVPLADSLASPALGTIKVYLTRPDLRTCARATP